MNPDLFDVNSEAFKNMCALTKRYGVTQAEIDSWQKHFGPELTALLVNQVQVTHMSPVQANQLMVFLLNLLTGHKDSIMSWLRTGEGALFDIFVTIVTSQNAILGAILARYKDTALGAEDKLVGNLLDQLIQALQAQSKTP